MKSILLLAMLYASLFAFNGKVVSIHDGDTITILQGKQQIKVRLFGIDAPELEQPYGKKSKQFLANLIAGEVVEVEPKGKDRYTHARHYLFQRARYKRSNGAKWLRLGLCKILENICKSRKAGS